MKHKIINLFFTRRIKEFVYKEDMKHKIINLFFTRRIKEFVYKEDTSC